MIPASDSAGRRSPVPVEACLSFRGKGAIDRNETMQATPEEYVGRIMKYRLNPIIQITPVYPCVSNPPQFHTQHVQQIYIECSKTVNPFYIKLSSSLQQSFSAKILLNKNLITYQIHISFDAQKIITYHNVARQLLAMLFEVKMNSKKQKRV